MAEPPSVDLVVQPIATGLQELASTDTPHDLAHILSAALLSRLKSINRTANTNTKQYRQLTADARIALNESNLGLQNLMYEKRHLEREIEKCRQFA